ncbi:response regulator [bacterium]|nr:response regulator [bacterium]MCI0602167.1 response regulator [bacterium]
MPKILVVDDEDDVRNLLMMIFRDAGYEVESARNGKEAVEKARKEKPDLIFLDILMPVMDGFEACSLLKKDPATRNIFIAFLTAKDMPQDWDRGLQSEADVYIAKPFNNERLIFVARELLALKEK